MSANRMFYVEASTVVSNCLQVNSQELASLWHRRYGHLSYKGLRTLQYEKMVKGLPQFQSPAEICTNCLVGKQTRESMSKRSS